MTTTARSWVRRAQRGHRRETVVGQGQRILDQQRADLGGQRRAADRVGEIGQGVRAHPRAIDERAHDRRLPQRRAAEHAGVHDRRVDGVRPDQRAALGGGEPRRLGQEVDASVMP